MSCFVWGQRVQVCDETHPSFGRIGAYEGTICADTGALRVRFHGGVVVAYAHQLLSKELPVCTYRRLKKSGSRPPIHRNVPPAACLFKDYGKTEAERALDMWLETGDEAALTFVLFGSRPQKPRRCRFSGAKA